MTNLPALSTMHADMRRLSAKQREAAQHAPRPSRIRFTVRTSGVGETRLVGRQALDFGAYMLDEPSMSFGLETLTSLRAGEMPQATAIVLNYLRNGAGLYTGAEVGFKIVSVRTDIRLKFFVTFEGTTMRSTQGTGTTTTDAPRDQNYYTGTSAQQIGSN